MKKPKLHKVKRWWPDGEGGYGMAQCYSWLFPRFGNYRKTWRGVTCKTCLRKKGKP